MEERQAYSLLKNSTNFLLKVYGNGGTAEDWKIRRLEDWMISNGKRQRRKGGRLEDWRIGRLATATTNDNDRNYELQTTNYQLQTTNYKLPSSSSPIVIS